MHTSLIVNRSSFVNSRMAAVDRFIVFNCAKAYATLVGARRRCMKSVNSTDLRNTVRETTWFAVQNSSKVRNALYAAALRGVEGGAEHRPSSLRLQRFVDVTLVSVRLRPTSWQILKGIAQK